MSSVFGMDPAAPPPLQWQADSLNLGAPGGFGPNRMNGALAPAVETTSDEVSTAWKHVSNVVRDDWKPVELFDLLSNSVRETQYSFQPQGWPALLRARSPMFSEMPRLVVDRYNACQTVAFCGVFPQLKRAWASVDNSLFLWRFDRWGDVPIEYSGEEQAICAVGLARPKPGVFVEAIRYVMLVCTTVEIVLLGVCCTVGPAGLGEPVEEVTLQPLPMYSCPSDNVTMTSVVATSSGRIFLGGADGNVYEVTYSASGRWLQKRCQKVCLTGGLRHLLPPLLPPLLFGQPSACVQLAVDDQRHILYSLSQSSAIQVFDLGVDGTEAARKAAELTDFLGEASRAAGGREVFGRGGGDKKGAMVVRLAVISTRESARLHCLAITADGRRVYLSTWEGRQISQNPIAQRPHALRAEIARAAVPHPGTTAGGRTAATTSVSGGRVSEVTAALYCDGILLLSDSGGGSGRNRLISTSRDLSIPPLGTATGPMGAASGLRETVSEMEMTIPGDTCAITSIDVSTPLTSAAQITMQDELRTQVLLPAAKFVLVSTSGVLEIERLRAVDVLQALLEERAGTKLEAFFQNYGAAEAAAMCIQLATTPAGQLHQVPQAVIQAAKQALDNTRLTGEPEMRDVGMQGMPSDDTPAPHFDMGIPIPVAEPEWSNAHKGLCLYTSRLMHPFWENHVAKHTKMTASSSVVECAFTIPQLQALGDKLRCLDNFLGDYLARRSSRGRSSVLAPLTNYPGVAGGRGYMGVGYYGAQGQPGAAAKRQKLEEAIAQETKRDTAICALVRRASECCYLLTVLIENNFPRTVARGDDSMRHKLITLKFRDLVSGADGEAVCAHLISLLVGQHMSATGVGVAEDLSVQLQSGCPSYFKEDDKTYYEASGLMQRAEAMGNLEDREALTSKAVQLMMKVPLSCDMGQVVPQLVFLQSFQGVVDLPLKKAAALDPLNVAAAPGPEGENARALRYEQCYYHVLQVLKWLIDPSMADSNGAVQLEGQLSDEERKRFRKIVLERAAASRDPFFHDVLYGTLVGLGATKELLSLDTPYLDGYLLKASGVAQSMAGTPLGPLTNSQVSHCLLLARYYVQRQRYAKACGVYEALAGRKYSPGEAAVTLEQRMDHYHNALLQAKSAGDGVTVERLEGRLKVVQLQQKLLEKLHSMMQSGDMAGLPMSDLQSDLAAISEELKELVDLYNDYAVKYKLWGLCIEMVNLSDYHDAGYVRQLWDVYLRHGYDSAVCGGGGPAMALEECCQRVEAVGSVCFPNESSFPVAHVCLRLEQLASGHWPERFDALENYERVAQALLSACHDNQEAVLRVYDSLLAVRGGDMFGDVLHAPLIRLRLLKSMSVVVRAAKDKIHQSAAAEGYAAVCRGPRRLIGALMESCERYSAEARRLVPQEDSTQVAAGFEMVARQMAQLVDMPWSH